MTDPLKQPDPVREAAREVAKYLVIRWQGQGGKSADIDSLESWIAAAIWEQVNLAVSKCCGDAHAENHGLTSSIEEIKRLAAWQSDESFEEALNRKVNSAVAGAYLAASNHPNIGMDCSVEWLRKEIRGCTPADALKALAERERAADLERERDRWRTTGDGLAERIAALESIEQVDKFIYTLKLRSGSRIGIPARARPIRIFRKE